jgi:hypothetical protein
MFKSSVSLAEQAEQPSCIGSELLHTLCMGYLGWENWYLLKK